MSMDWFNNTGPTFFYFLGAVNVLVYTVKKEKFHKGLRKVSVNSKFPADLLTSTKEILNGKCHFLYSERKFSVVICLQIFQNFPKERIIFYLQTHFPSSEKIFLRL